VISEAMAWGLPVIAHEADGTELDLVKDHESGRILELGTVESFIEALSWMEADPARTQGLGQAARELLEARFTVERYAEAVRDALYGVVAIR